MSARFVAKGTCTRVLCTMEDLMVQLETARQQLEDALNAQADAIDRLFTEPPQ